jgi:uncharacterized membrane protein YedE/YeeE
VIGVAIVSAGASLLLLRRPGARTLTGESLRLVGKPFASGLFLGGIVFGVGWALSGACPGTALAQLGEGKLYALATIAGITLGTWIFLRVGRGRILAK